MNIKELEQTVSRYWEGATTQEEERAIRSFYAEHDGLPDELERWRDWFGGQHDIARMEPDEGFDDRVMALIGQSRAASRRRRLRLLVWPAAAAAVLLAAVLTRALTERSHTPGPDEIAQYETVKQLLYTASAGLNRAETIIGESIEKATVIDEYIHIE